MRFLMEIINPALKCERVGGHDASLIESRTGFRKPLDGEIGVACIAVTQYRPVCSHCSTVLGSWVEAKWDGFATYNGPLEHKELFESQGEYWSEQRLAVAQY